MPILFSIGKIHFYTFGVFVATGILFGSLLVEILSRRDKLRMIQVFDTLLLITIIGLAVARLSYFIVYFEQFGSFWQLLYFWQGGLVAFTGIVAGTIFALWYFPKHHEHPWRWLDIMMIGFLLAWIFGLVGSYVAGTGLGQNNQIVNTSTNIINIWEAGWVLITLAVLFYIWEKKLLREGYVFFVGMLIFNFGRFIFDFWRDSMVAYWGLSFGQIAEIVIILAIIIFLTKFKRYIHPNIWEKMMMRLKIK